MIIVFSRHSTRGAKMGIGDVAPFPSQGLSSVLTVGPPLLPIMYWTSKQYWLGRSS